MIVDCHTHIDFAVGDIAVSDHLTAAEQVDACLVLAPHDGKTKEVNKKLSDYAGKHKEKMIGLAVINPIQDKSKISNLNYIKDELGLKGVVLYCSAFGMHPAHSKAMKMYESAEELGLVMFFHNSWPAISRDSVLDYVQPFLLDEIAREFPSLKIIIGNMGVPFVEQTLLMVAKHENVYADLTIEPKNVWQTYNTVVAAHEHEVMDKLLFGSGFPKGNAGLCMETLLGFNTLLADTNLPTVPRGSIRNIIERDALELLGVKLEIAEKEEQKSLK